MNQDNTGVVRVLRNGHPEFDRAVDYFNEAREVAASSPCAIDKRGAIVVGANGEIAGRGYNGPDIEWGDWITTTCTEACCPYRNNNRPCPGLHAELRAILQAPRDTLRGAAVYHVKIDRNMRMVRSRSTCTRERKACPDCAPKLREVGIREIGIVVEVSEDGARPTEIHMCPIDGSQDNAYFYTAFRDLIDRSTRIA